VERSSFPRGCPTRLARCSFLSLTQYLQLRRRNDGVDCRALRWFGHGRCPETPHRFGVQARAETPHRERPNNIPTPRRLERLKQFSYYVDMMMFKYRVTKYDPRKRDNEGRYLAEEWTRYSQVGQVIAERAFTHASIPRKPAAGSGSPAFLSPGPCTALRLNGRPLAPKQGLLLQLARVVHKRTAIQLPRPRRQHKSRASGPGSCGVYLLGFVSSARRRPVADQPPVARIFAPVSPRMQAYRGKTHTKIFPPRD